jgi:hypothetical protein
MIATSRTHSEVESRRPIGRVASKHDSLSPNHSHLSSPTMLRRIETTSS